MKETPVDTVSSDDITQRWLEGLCRRTDEVLWNSYRFALGGSGAKAQRALTDLALYRHAHDEPALAVEFKSGGRSGKSEMDESIRKDVAKVLAEQPEALWLYVVRSVNN